MVLLNFLSSFRSPNFTPIFVYMTPEKRLNQIEPELAEVIQKVDRLIESNGQILELALNTKAAGESTARAVANLTVSTQVRFEQVNTRFDGVDARFDGVDARFDQVGTRFDEVDTQINQVSTQFGQVNARFDQLDDNQNEMRLDIAQLKAGQELILQILREKLT